MATTRLRRYLKRFPFVSGLRHYLADRCVRRLDPHGRIAYSQTGEDMILETLLPLHNHGFYVDVGSHHPTRWSNTFRLYKRGWSGIAIDVNDDLVDAHRRLRPRDTAVCAAVTDRIEQAVLTEFDEPALSSLSATHVEAWRGERSVLTTRAVTTTTQGGLLEDCSAPPRFEMLSVDVEGRDLEVLRGLDFERHRPHLVVVEMHDFDLANREATPAYRHLVEQGYDLHGYVICNGYFVDARAADEA